MKPEGFDNPPEGYRWVKVGEDAGVEPGDNAILREEAGQPYLLVKLGPPNFGDRHLARVYRVEDDRERPAIGFVTTTEGAEALGTLTREHQPEDQGQFRYRLAIIVEGEVKSAPFLFNEIRGAGIIEGLDPADVDRLLARIKDRLDPLAVAQAEARAWFQDAKFGMFIHWGVYSLLGRGEWVMNKEKISISEYEKLPSQFNPTEFDAEAWVKTARDAGQRYITITSKHHDGFCMYDSKLTEYDIVDATPYGKDPLKALADACHTHGIKLFFYYSLLDWHHPDYFPRGRTGHDAGRPDEGHWDDYVSYYQGQVRELCTNYGEIGGIWFDGWWDRPDAAWDLEGTYRLIHKLQPGALVGNNHHVTPFPGEDFQMFEQDLPGENSAGFNKAEATNQLPLETCLTMNHSWGYNAKDDNWKSPEEIIHTLLGSAGRGANLLLNIGPRPDGTLQPEAVERLREVGTWLDKYGKTVYGTRRGPVPPQKWGVVLSKRDPRPSLFIHVMKPDGEIRLPGIGQGWQVRPFGGAKAVAPTSVDDGIRFVLPESIQTPIDTILVLNPAIYEEFAPPVPATPPTEPPTPR